MLYKVKIDSGIAAAQAQEIFEEAMKDDTLVPLVGEQEDDLDGFIVRERTKQVQIKTGFYIDERKTFKVTPKVFLVINKSEVSLNSNVLVVRPNLGKYYCGVSKVRKNIGLRRWKFCETEAKVQRALQIWQKEFELADIPSSDKYQFSCPGRHSHRMILAVSN